MSDVRKFRTVGRIETSALDVEDGAARECFVSFPSAGDEAMLTTVSEERLRAAGIAPEADVCLTALVNLAANTPEELAPEGLAPAEVPTDEELGL